MKRLQAVLFLLLLIVSGCASINYNEIAPNAKTFKPKVVVVLPAIKMPEGADQEADKAAQAIYDAAVATKQFERVIDPLMAKSQLSENRELQDAVLTFTTKLRSLAITDKDSCQKIGAIYQADTIIVGDVGKWGYSRTADEKAGEVGIAIKMVDAATGSVYWKAAHAEKKTYSLFSPNLADMAAAVSKKMFDFMPKP